MSADRTEARAVWFTEPRRAEILTEQIGPCGDREIKVQAIASGISSASELIIYRGDGPRDQAVTPRTSVGASMGDFPIKYGYQSVGRVIEAGSETSWSIGDLVFARFPHQDLFIVEDSPDLVNPLPSLSDPTVAVLANLADVAYNALLDVPVRLGDSVVVFGQGVVGLFITQLAARTAGQLIVVDPLESRRRLAEQLGAQVAVTPEDAPAAIGDLIGPRKADICFEASGAPPALQQAISLTGMEGTVCVVSWYGDKEVPLVLSPEFHMGRQRLVSSQVCEIGSGLQPRWSVERRMKWILSELSNLHPDDVITKRVPFESAPSVYEELISDPEGQIMVALEY